jgi:hypothetical protein
VRQAKWEERMTIRALATTLVVPASVHILPGLGRDGRGLGRQVGREGRRRFRVRRLAGLRVSGGDA